MATDENRTDLQVAIAVVQEQYKTLLASILRIEVLYAKSSEENAKAFNRIDDEHSSLSTELALLKRDFEWWKVIAKWAIGLATTGLGAAISMWVKTLMGL
jgi:hypothetical protein